MKRYLFTATLIAIFAVSAFAVNENKEFHQQQKAKINEHITTQKAENKEFRGTLKGMTPGQKKEAIVVHRDQQKTENMGFRKDLYDQNRAKLQQRLASNKKLNDQQRADLLMAFDDNYTDRSGHREMQYQENADFISKISNDTTLTQDQKKAAIKDHFKAQMDENKKFQEQEKAKMMEEKKTIKSEGTQTKPAAPATSAQ
jgi:LmbE family N-acetylglucosaminyl deacetylase